MRKAEWKREQLSSSVLAKSWSHSSKEKRRRRSYKRHPDSDGPMAVDSKCVQMQAALIRQQGVYVGTVDVMSWSELDCYIMRVSIPDRVRPIFNMWESGVFCNPASGGLRCTHISGQLESKEGV